MNEMGSLAERYVAAWNIHDPVAVRALFAESGTYEDPTTGGPVEGRGITEAAARLTQAFPDLSFEIVDMLQGGRRAAIEWVMRGTNTGSFTGAPPTRSPLALRGGLFLYCADDLVTSAVAFFDQRTLATQIGLHAPVMARQAGPMRFGTSVRLDKGNRAQPGALSFTRLDMGSPAGLLRLRSTPVPCWAAWRACPRSSALPCSTTATQLGTRSAPGARPKRPRRSWGRTRTGRPCRPSSTMDWESRDGRASGFPHE